MSENSKRKLFEEFPPVSTEEWEEKIKTDLKGVDYKKTLIWETIEGIDIKPYYRKDDLDKLGYLESEPDLFPFVRGNKTGSNDWEICQQIHVQHIGTANKDAQFALNRGATSIEFVIPDGVVKNKMDLSDLLKEIPIEKTRLDLYTSSDPLDLLRFLHSVIESRKIQKGKVRGIIGYDPIGEFTLTGRFEANDQTVIALASNLISFSKVNLPNFRSLVLNGKNFKNAGSTIVQELGYTLSVGVEYLSSLTDSGLSVDEIAPGIQINFAVGSNYFMEIAKIRAARLLWSKIIEAYHPKLPEASKIHIHTVTSDWNKTAYDPYVNLLRTTTEAMSSSLGGTDSLTVNPFDSVFKKPSPLSERLARNIQIILKEEAYFNRVIDPAAGSYYVENLTDSLAREAWKLFLSIEDNGGFLNAFRKGIIQSEIEENARKREQNITFRRKKFLGTNQFPNLHERIIKDIDPSVFHRAVHREPNPEAKPLTIYRAVESYEKLRFKTEQFKGKTPNVYLFKIGNLAMRIARATFSSNFFGCAGFKIIEGPGCQSVEEGLSECLQHKPDIIVICSSDSEYEKFVPELFAKIKGHSLFVVAGYPKDLMERFTTIGIRYFIHTKSNVLETLQQMQNELKIN
jgi:methylmalonyl-CoA mutase